MLIDRSEEQTVALKGIDTALNRLAQAFESNGHGNLNGKARKSGTWTAAIDQARAERLVSDLGSSRTLLYVRTQYLGPT